MQCYSLEVTAENHHWKSEAEHHETPLSHQQKIMTNHHYAPNFEKVGSILLSACACVRACVRPFVRPFKKIQARVFKFHKWIPRQIIAYPYFFLV